jgi:hypothetical protein
VNHGDRDETGSLQGTARAWYYASNVGGHSNAVVVVLHVGL